jgi:hypothetical protein
MKFHVYYIEDENRKGLHYVQGHLYWRELDNVETILDLTMFHTIKDTYDFIKRNKIKGFIGEYTIEVSK